MVARGLLSLVVAGLLVPRVARADDASTNAVRSAAEPEAGDRRYGRMLLEVGGVTAIMTGWYWTHLDLSKEDFEMDWSWNSWRQKLTSLDTLRFDTNGFYINAVSHPLAGLFEYQAARANGFGMAGSTLINLGGAVIWEYVVEFKERPSLNDIIVNTAVGAGGAEPVLQIGRALARGRPSLARRALAFLLSPFDVVNGWMDGRRPARTPAPWLVGRVLTGGRAVRLSPARTRTEASIGMEFELRDQAGYGRPGVRSGATHAGAWSFLRAGLDFGPGGTDAGLVGVQVDTRASYFGRYAQEVVEAPGGRRGGGRFLGVGGGFDFDMRRLAEEYDQLATLHLAGPLLQLDAYLGAATLRWQLGAYGDFALVTAHVFGPVPPFHPEPIPTSALRSQGYYFGYGATLDSRLRIALADWNAEIDLSGQLARSIDGLDRTEMSGVEDPHGVADQRGRAHLELGTALGSAGIGLVATGDVTLRRGTWADLERGTLEASVGLFLTATP